MADAAEAFDQIDRLIEDAAQRAVGIMQEIPKIPGSRSGSCQQSRSCNSQSVANSCDNEEVNVSPASKKSSRSRCSRRSPVRSTLKTRLYRSLDKRHVIIAQFSASQEEISDEQAKSIERSMQFASCERGPRDAFSDCVRV